MNQNMKSLAIGAAIGAIGFYLYKQRAARAGAGLYWDRNCGPWSGPARWPAFNNMPSAAMGRSSHHMPTMPMSKWDAPRPGMMITPMSSSHTQSAPIAPISKVGPEVQSLPTMASAPIAQAPAPVRMASITGPAMSSGLKVSLRNQHGGLILSHA